MAEARWAFLNPETGDWIEVKPGTVGPLAPVIAALTDEDEIAHGEAVMENRRGQLLEMNVCAYCGSEWPCRTQRGIDRLLDQIGRKP